MMWCIPCQEYVEAVYETLIGPSIPLGPRCPKCKTGLKHRERPVEPEPVVNNGAWDISEFHLSIGACHSPAFDVLMTRLRELERDGASTADINTARAKAIAYLLQHKSLIIVGGHCE